MKNEAVFLKCTQQVIVSKTTTPEFTDYTYNRFCFV